MGWVIKRADGTFRAWNGVAQTGEPLRPGESWEAHDTMPILTADPLTPAEVDALADAELDAQKTAKAIVLWVAGKLNIPPGQARNEIKAIRKTL